MMDRKRLDMYKVPLGNTAGGTHRTGLAHGRRRTLADEDATQDPADKAANSYTKELLFSQSNSERNMLGLINEALERIADGSYGECVDMRQ